MVNSFHILYYYLFDLDNFVLKIIKANNTVPNKEDKEKSIILERINLILD